MGLTEQTNGEVQNKFPRSLENLENFIDTQPPKFFDISAKYSRQELQDPDHPYASRMAHQRAQDD